MPDRSAFQHPKHLLVLLRLKESAHKACDPLSFSLNEAALLFQVEIGVKRHEEYGALLGVRAVMVSAIITKLVRRHLITRAFDKNDGRRVELKLTVEGCVVVSQLRRAWEEQMATEH